MQGLQGRNKGQNILKFAIVFSCLQVLIEITPPPPAQIKKKWNGIYL